MAIIKRTSESVMGKVMLGLLAVYAAVTLGRLVVQEGVLLYKGHVLQVERTQCLEKRAELLQEINHSGRIDGVEELAREKLGLVQPGEVPIKSTEASPSDDPSP